MAAYPVDCGESSTVAASGIRADTAPPGGRRERARQQADDHDHAGGRTPDPHQMAAAAEHGVDTCRDEHGKRQERQHHEARGQQAGEQWPAAEQTPGHGDGGDVAADVEVRAQRQQCQGEEGERGPAHQR